LNQENPWGKNENDLEKLEDKNKEEGWANFN
jgi:hypothetical protein